MAGANPGIHCFRGSPPKPCAALPGLRMAAQFICFVALMQGAAFAVCTHPHRGVIWPVLISGFFQGGFICAVARFTTLAPCRGGRYTLSTRRGASAYAFRSHSDALTLRGLGI